MRFRAVLLLIAAGTLGAQTSREWLNRGVQEFKSARYAEAVADFQRAVEADPNGATARLYLGAAYMQQYIPGDRTPENLAFAENARRTFQQVIDLDSGNKVALSYQAALAMNMRKFDEARAGYKRLLAVDPGDKSAWYSLAFIAWSQWYPAYNTARAQLQMRPEDPGPLPDAAARAALRTQWMPVIDEGIGDLNRALALDAQYADAMAYMNLFARERACLRDTPEEYAGDMAEADRWMQKALAAKKEKAQ
jgi:tetratricopeptide (TPR) repeat protein